MADETRAKRVTRPSPSDGAKAGAKADVDEPARARPKREGE